MSAAESLPNLVEFVPFDVESEENCIAAATLATDYGDRDLLPAMQTIVQPHMFFRDKHQWAWSAICDLALRGEPVNVSTVAHELGKNGLLEDFGGQTHLVDITRSLPTTVGAEWYAEQVQQTWLRRQFIHLANGLARAVAQHEDDPANVADEWLGKLLRVGDMRRRDSVVEAADYYVNQSAELLEFLEDPTAIRGIETPWHSFNRATGGLKPSVVYVVMADTSVGKSLFVQQIAMNAALHRRPVVFATGEMSAQEVFDRLAFMRAAVDPQLGVRRGMFTQGEKERVHTAMWELADMVLPVVHDLSITTVVAETRRLVSAGKCELLIVDHIQHVNVPKAENKTATIEEAMRQLKALAMSEGIPVLIVSHINRATHHMGMTNASAKASGSIEQDANVTMSLTPGRMVAGQWEPFETVEEAEGYQAKHNEMDVKLRLMKQRGGIKSSLVLKQDWNRGGQYGEVTRD